LNLSKEKKTLSDQQYNQAYNPAPPPVGGNPMYEPNVLNAKAREAADDAKQALIMSIIGIFCFGFILGFIAFKKANSALEIMNHYQVAEDKRGIATVAKTLAVIDIVLWALGLIARFTILR
jgi:hypothetical protein